jgi:hypothetical protein
MEKRGHMGDLIQLISFKDKLETNIYSLLDNLNTIIIILTIMMLVFVLILNKQGFSA